MATMKVRDFIEFECDVDVYDDVCEELGICCCGPVLLTEEGKREFADVLDYNIDLVPSVPFDGEEQTWEYGVVEIDDEEGVWQKKLKRAKKFFYSAAGYCVEDEYKKWFN